MGEPRFLLIRLGAIGDIVHTLPAAASLRDSFPAARIDWVVEQHRAALLDGNPDVNEVIAMDRKSAGSIRACVGRMRENAYTHAVDFQSLYKSALLGFASGARERTGFHRTYVREPLAAIFYTRTALPAGRHKVNHHLALAEILGARSSAVRFPIRISPEAANRVAKKLKAAGAPEEFFVMSPGGGWQSKCWPAGRYGELHEQICNKFGWRGVINYGPGEDSLVQAVESAAGKSRPVALKLELAEMIALVSRAKFFVGGDSGPLHVASALGTPVVGLYGPTDPGRNGPWSREDIVVRLPSAVTTYERGRGSNPAMLAITVAQMMDAIARRLAIA
jgi:heptosyltransferase I